MLRVLAISAPHWQGDSPGCEEHLCSATPFSMLNALRGAFKRLSDQSSGWYHSNWSTQDGLSKSIFMSDYEAQATHYLRQTLFELKPNLVLIGSMTLSTAGAYHIAKIVREYLGDKVFILIGGKHVNETVYLENNDITNHISSPLQMMKKGDIDHVFDAVASGDCEELIAELGDIIYQNSFNNSFSPQSLYSKYFEVLKRAKENWLFAWLDKETMDIDYLQGDGALEYENLPNVYKYYPANTNFKVLGGDYTAHAYSDSSKGCIYSCHFCSESAHINGKVKNLSYSAKVLSKSFDKIHHYCPDNTTVFVEDSILLQGSPKGLREFADMLEAKEERLDFGCQLTVDNILTPKVAEQIIRLSKVGLKYIFIGLETGEENLAQLMSKNRSVKMNHDIKLKPQTWLDKVRLVFDFCKEHHIKVGVSILFGLGETQENRVSLLSKVLQWQCEFSYPSVVSMNWAVKHPLRSKDTLNQYKYFSWGISKNNISMKYLTNLFGEVSDKYHLDGVESMTHEEIIEVSHLYSLLKNEI